MFKRMAVLLSVLGLLMGLLGACSNEETLTPQQQGQTKANTSAQPGGSAGGLGLSGDAQAVAQARNFTPDDVTAALKSYVPPGKYDDYLMFASGGHSGQVLVIGIPSMRLLKVIAVFTPEPWQGYGVGSLESKQILDGGKVNGKDITWADVHHPGLSETNGLYDG